MNVKDTQAAIASTTSVAELQAMKEGESRKTVLDAIAARILELTDGEEPEVEEEEEEPTPAAPPVVKGKGAEKTTAHKPTYQVKAPKATGLLGFNGKLYTRAQVAKDPDLMQRMYAAGCKAIIKA